MQVMIWTELKKLRRSRMLLVALFGLCMVLVIVTAQGFFAGGNEAYGMEPEWYLTGVQSLGTLYALPGIIAQLVLVPAIVVALKKSNLAD